jgi:phosphate:Na+ symporter
MQIIIGLIGGLGLFLYGMNIMGTGLEKTAGDRMKKIIEILTNNKYMAVLVGAFVTAIVQSSSATTVMVVGFVNAGIMSLTQAVGIIMGANIGTTVTAQIVALDLSNIAPLAVGIGVLVWLFAKNRRIKNTAEILIGFGILFIGMDFMKDAVAPLREFEGFRNMLLSFGDNNIMSTMLAIFTGFAITAVVQSSSATTGILIALASEGLLPIQSAFPILLGTNIGTCVTAMLSSVGASKTAKRAALIHLMFNVIGTLVFIIIFAGPTVAAVIRISPENPVKQLANAHTFFNIMNTVLLLPFSVVLVKIAQKIIPYSADEEKEIEGIKYLDDRILETPSIALIQVIKEVLHMSNLTKYSYENAMDALVNQNEKGIKNTFRVEKKINELERGISSYLVKLSNREVSNVQREIINGLFNTINDIERVGDHAENIAELAERCIEDRLIFSDKAKDEVQFMSDRVMKSFIQSMTSLATGEVDLAEKVIQREDEIDDMEKNLRRSHIDRLNQGMCVTNAGVIFLDVISNLERIGDHASNIAWSVIDSSALHYFKNA